MTKTILTIDDEEVILNLLRELFEDEGYAVAQASTPREDLPDVPIILLTGVFIDEKLSGKITAYHNKTTSLSDLITTVENLLPNDWPPTTWAVDQ